MYKIIVLVSCFLISSFGQELEEVEKFQKYLKGNRKFASDTYRELSTLTNDKENFVVCPFSAETILALTINGAKGETKSEIEEALNFSNSTDETNSLFKKLLEDLKRNNGYTLQTANKVYVNKNYHIKGGFKKVATKIYQAGVQNVDFTKKKRAAKMINNWVSKQTNNTIKNLLDSKILSHDTVAVLINALYFQANWMNNFKPILTRQRNFYKSDQETVRVEMMKQIDYYDYYKSEELSCQFLQIYFRGGRKTSMVFVLPNEKEGLKQLETRIEDIYNVSNFQEESIEVILPKFKIESNIDYKKILTQLGVKHAFNKADFSGLADEDIFISDILQKSFVSVNENGVKAAAATAVLFHPKTLMNPFRASKQFVADHPFLFYIKVDDVVIFTGRVVSP